jgi:methionyl-tRNA formyltransferase
VRIVFLTTDDPLYLPDFFDRVLESRGRETALVAIVPPLYAGQTTGQAVRRYYRTFGAADTMQLARRVLAAKAARRSVASVSAQHGVAYGRRHDVNAPEFLDELRGLGTDLIVSVSCPQLFRKPLIELPDRGCLNVHGAVLPQYRGIMPSFWMLANGERQAGVSIYIVDERIDAGDLCAQRTFDISPDETLHAFLKRSKQVAAELLLETLAAVESGTMQTTPLDLAGGSYYSWPDREAVRRFRAAGRRLW